jgi:AcrR family transcriptional regulator
MEAAPQSDTHHSQISIPAAVLRRDRLIEAATRLFCRYGVNSIGVDEIVAAAGTAKTT